MTPCKKTYFADEKTALQYVERLQNTSKRKVVPDRAYLCERCLNWHITSLPLKKEQTYKDLIVQHQNSLKSKNGRIKNLEKKELQYQERIRELSKKVDFYRNQCAELQKKK